MVFVALLCCQQTFTDRINSIYQERVDAKEDPVLKDGYAPFCKHVRFSVPLLKASLFAQIFVPNFVGVSPPPNALHTVCVTASLTITPSGHGKHPAHH